MEMTFALIKPDAVAAKNSGKIIDMIEQHGFTIAFLQKIKITREGAELLYWIHQDKPFFAEAVQFLSSGPLLLMALSKENAIEDWRKLMGATNPAFAEEGTIRKLFGTDIEQNAVHGSDSPKSAKRELDLFFGSEDDLEEARGKINKKTQ